jgi:predicted Zn-dependent peptidase
MNDTKEKYAHTPGSWVISCIDEVKDSLMVGGGDDGSDIVADVRTYENDILNAQAELYDDIPAMRSRAHVHGDCTEKIDKLEKEVRERLAELESKEKEARANARLIAAAPNMYEVLSELLDTLEMSKGYGFDVEYEKAREVLAKVEGGEG